MNVMSLIAPVIGLVCAPLLVGVINRTKAFFAGRRGQPVWQLYLDLWRLMHKGAVYSRTTTAVFRLGPVVNLCCVVLALCMVPLLRVPGPIRFAGDFLVVAYLLGLGRFFTILAALDTGSSFEGMGASRESLISTLAEPALLLSFATLAMLGGELSLSGLLGAISTGRWAATGPVLALVTVALLLVLLAENARIPIDDPNTHLELTMVHEAMVLDHSGPDFALIQYAAALKLWLFASVVAAVAIPVGQLPGPVGVVVGLLGVLGLGVVVGVIESTVARLRMVAVPQFLVGAGALALTAMLVAVFC